MPELSDFRLGADVFDSTGKKAGTLACVLVDEDGFEPRGLVLKDETTFVGRMMAAEKLFVTDEVVIPISAVESADHEQVRISLAASEVKRQKPYLRYQIEPMGAAEALFKEAQVLGGALGLPDAKETADKPATEIEIDKDENVMLGNSGQRLGRVEDLLLDGGELVAVVIKPDGMFKHDLVLPIRFLSRGDDLALFADMDEKDIERLQPFVED